MNLLFRYTRDGILAFQSLNYYAKHCILSMILIHSRTSGTSTNMEGGGVSDCILPTITILLSRSDFVNRALLAVQHLNLYMDHYNNNNNSGLPVSEV